MPNWTFYMSSFNTDRNVLPYFDAIFNDCEKFWYFFEKSSSIMGIYDLHMIYFPIKLYHQNSFYFDIYYLAYASRSGCKDSKFYSKKIFHALSRYLGAVNISELEQDENNME